MNSQRKRAEIIKKITATAEAAKSWHVFSAELKEHLIAIYSQELVLKLTYDRVFKAIFDPEIHGERLSRLLSALLGQQVKVIRGIPTEGNNRSSSGKRIYFDILVELEDGSMADVEMQKDGRQFPNTRAAVYSSDMVVKQYAKLKSVTVGSENDEDDIKLDFDQIHKVYTIVLMEHSTIVFRKFGTHYIHRSRQVFDSGIELDMLQEYVFINMDVYKKLVREPDNELEAWLSYLCADTIAEVDAIIEKFPYFKNVKSDVILYEDNNVQEVVSMFTDGFFEGIDILDANSDYNYKKKLEKENEELEGKNKELQGANEELQGANEELQGANEELQKEIERLKAQLNQ